VPASAVPGGSSIINEKGLTAGCRKSFRTKVPKTGLEPALPLQELGPEGRFRVLPPSCSPLPRVADSKWGKDLRQSPVARPLLWHCSGLAIVDHIWTIGNRSLTSKRSGRRQWPDRPLPPVEPQHLTRAPKNATRARSDSGRTSGGPYPSRPPAGLQERWRGAATSSVLAYPTSASVAQRRASR